MPSSPRTTAHGPRTTPLILASASPRRAELLRQANIPFEVIVSPAEEPERKPAGIPTDLWPACLAYMKAGAVQSQMNHEKSAMKNKIILAADTIVVLNDRVLNKPRSRAHARRMLCALSGRTHQVITGICLLRGPQVRLSRAVAICRCNKLSPAQLGAYLDSKQWQGKAGAYGIQDPLAGRFITLLSGDITTVIGLPMSLVQRELLYAPALLPV